MFKWQANDDCKGTKKNEGGVEVDELSRSGYYFLLI